MAAELTSQPGIHPVVVDGAIVGQAVDLGGSADGLVERLEPPPATRAIASAVAACQERRSPNAERVLEWVEVGRVTQSGSIRRSFVVRDAVLTVSDAGVESSSLATLAQLGWAAFPPGEPHLPPGPPSVVP